MLSDPQSSPVQIIKSLFKSREDVFAIRWEKGGKSGYMPSYSYDPYLYRAHKMKGGTFQNYNDKSYLKLSDKEIEKHLNGDQQIGIYPLLPDNTSSFIAADFDKADWINDARKFLTACTERNVPAWLERSRSGEGGHVWIFFEQPYPAIKSRKIFLSLLENSGAFSMFDKSSSFDRFFPNQDFLSGKGLGNLIALPLYKKALDLGNSCFIDAETMQVYIDQFAFLKSIRKISPMELDVLYESISQGVHASMIVETNGKLKIKLGTSVKISRSGMTQFLISYLKEELNFANSAFAIKNNIGKNTFGTERYFKFVEEADDGVMIPRGFIGKLIRICRENRIEYEFIDQRKKQKEVDYSFTTILREHQQLVIDIIANKDLGVIVAPPGSGKTIVALKIIADKRQPALIVVHRKQLVEQWVERIETFLGIPKHEIGKIGSGKLKIGSRITIATIQSLSKELAQPASEVFQGNFGIVIMDECHHIPAETYRNTISKIPSYYLYGLTATPFRKYNDGKIIFFHLGEIIAEIKTDEIRSAKQAKVIIRNTELDIPFSSKTDQFETLSRILIHDSARNKLILTDVKNELQQGKRAVIITERKDHIDSLHQFLKQTFETIMLSGADHEKSRNEKWKILKEGNYQVLITTGQFFGEGTDLPNVNCLFLVYPFSFEGKLVQYIGRVQRSEISPTIYDYRDIKIDYLNKIFLKRNTFYRKIERQATLFDDQEIVDEKPNRIHVEREIKVPIAQLEFRYGSFGFKYFIPEFNLEIDFDIENSCIRPEFEVLKSYFAKALNSNAVKINIQLELESGEIVSQLSFSNDLEKINQELIESVKFTFVQKNFMGKSAQQSPDLLSVNGDKNTSPYSSGEELLDDVLMNGKYKHQMHLQYLASHHEKSIMKIRYVLNPFAFVFLLSGAEQFHIILETLDTEEATYLWHFTKNIQILKSKLKEIDEQLGIIKNKGRQAFLTNPPENFSRIIHDYTDDRKGFIIWKDQLEERIN